MKNYYWEGLTKQEVEDLENMLERRLKMKDELLKKFKIKRFVGNGSINMLDAIELVDGRSYSSSSRGYVFINEGIDDINSFKIIGEIMKDIYAIGAGVRASEYSHYNPYKKTGTRGRRRQDVFSNRKTNQNRAFYWQKSSDRGCDVFKDNNSGLLVVSTREVC